MDDSTATLVVAIIGSFTSLAGIVLTAVVTKIINNRVVETNAKVNETHHMVTVNGGASTTPTVLDHLMHLKDDIGELNSRVENIERKISD